MTVVGFIACIIDYRVVGWFYHADFIEGRGVGHVMHWIIRLFVFLIICYVVAIAIRIYKWIGVPVYVWRIVMAVISVGLILNTVIRRQIHSKYEK